MKKSFFSTVVLMAMAMLIFTGCAKLPQAEIDSANAAIESTRAAGADVYVPEAFVALTDSLASVMESITSKDSKMFKNFKQETEKLLSIVSQSAEVKALTEAKVAELKEQVDQMMLAISGNIDAAKALIGQAPKGKEGNTALLAIKADVTAIETSLGELKTVAGTENYFTTLDKAKAIDAQITSIKTELEEVISKFNSRNRK
jgi:cob(I)alamin adenosyltransferase